MPKKITLKCANCGTDFERDESRFRHDIKRNPEYRWHCSIKCQHAGQKTTSKIVKKCEHCGNDFTLNDKVQRFCSSRCAAIFNNPRKPRKPKPPKKPRGSDYITTTLRELRGELGTRNWHTRIRTNARAVFERSGNPMVCEACGYDIHVDICHIVGVARFSMDTPIALVNSIDNLIALDKRCHWEFDNGYLLLSEIQGGKE